MSVPTRVERSIVGRVVDDRYRVLEHIADGGMGTVFVALDTRLDRPVALKVMRADLAGDEAFVGRFRREARTAARLTHPHVVAVTDQGSDGHYVFLAMELVTGGTLRQLIRDRAPLTVGQALDLLDPILDGLAAAHRAGLVHRDIKPENVLISDEGVVKVTDFGLARAVTTDSMSADSGVLLGTASYLSPEQVEHGTATERSDVYSAGLLLFEMLTGQKAFPGESPIHVAYQHVHGSVPSVCAANPAVPAAVEEFIDIATRTDPAQRPASAADLLIALRSLRRRLTPQELGRSPRPGVITPRPARAGDRLPSAAESGSHTAELGNRTAGLPTPVTAHTHRARRRPTGRLLALLLVPILVLAIAAAWLFTLGPLGQTTVPTVAGSSTGVAVDTVHRAGLHVKVDQVFSESVASGKVIGSTPRGGGDIRKTGTVVLQVSKGPQRFTVPSVGGKTEAEARAAITAASLTVGTVTHSYDENVPSGQVVSTDPGTGKGLKRGTAVALIISQGKQPIPLPDLAGTAATDGEKQLTDLGLTVSEGTPAYSDTVPAGSIISTSPGPNTVMHKGDSVTVVVSKGPEMVTVPNVVGKSASQARSVLEAAGLKVKISRFFGGIFDNVRDQSVKPGTQVKKGSTVTLSVV